MSQSRFWYQKKYRRVDNGKQNVGFHWQVLTPGDQVAIDHVLLEEIARNQCDMLNAALVIALKEERQVFDELVNAALEIEQVIDENGIVSDKMHPEICAALRKALTGVERLVGVPA